MCVQYDGSIFAAAAAAAVSGATLDGIVCTWNVLDCDLVSIKTSAKSKPLLR